MKSIHLAQIITVYCIYYIDPFNNDVICRKTLWKQSLFMTNILTKQGTMCRV